MGRAIRCAAALALVVVSCTDSGREPEATVADEPELGPGRLVILDTTGDVVVMGPDGADRTQVTDDAGTDVAYTQPIWSPDATTLAFGQVSEDGFAVAIQRPGLEPKTLVETSNLPFYMFWSPDGESLGVLHNGTAGIDFRMVDVARGTSATVDTGAPYYFSWSPAGDQVVTHVGEDRVETIQADGARLELEPSSPTYLAPQWTDRGVFHVVGDELVIEDPDGARTPVASVAGFTMFVVNPQGTRVALQVVGESTPIQVAFEDVPTVPTGGVVVVDVESGEVGVASQSPSVGFFWSPDGESLLIMGISDDLVVPHVWQTSGESAEFTEYRPSGTVARDLLPFFPQYAQSLTFWSPDSTAFAFGGAIEGDQGIWVQRVDETAPTKVSDGIWVAWSGSDS